MAKKKDKFFDKMKKDAKDIGDIKLKHRRVKHKPERIIKHDEHHESNKRKVENKISPAYETKNIDDALVENFVSLQRVMTNLAASLDNLSNRMSRLLDLFEASAKSLAEKDMEAERKNDEIKRRLDNLTEHNKVFAQGLTLLHERANPEISQIQGEQRPLQKMPVQTMQRKMDADGYQRSISSPKS